MADLNSSQLSDKKLGIAIIGLGKYATEQLLPALGQSKFCELRAIVTGSPEKAEKYGNKYCIPEQSRYNYDNFGQIKENKAIDAVYIVLPNALHAEYTIKAVNAGKHVICEKPMATNVEDCEIMIAACKEANKLLFIGYRLHYESYNVEAMRIGQMEKLGKIKRIEASFGFDVGEPGQWRLKKDLAGGGSLFDVGIYTIQAARYILGRDPVAVKNVLIKKSTDPKFAEVEEEIHWEMEFNNGVTASCFASYTQQVDRLFAETEQGWIEVQPAFQYAGQKARTSKGIISLPEVNQQAAQLDGMAQTILIGSRNKATGVEGLLDVQIIEAIYESVQTGTRVVVDKMFSY